MTFHEIIPYILLIEDNENDVEIVKSALSEQLILCNLITLKDGENAINYFRDVKNAIPDLILLNLSLPKLNGLEVLKSLRSNIKLNDVPIIILTSSDRSKDLSEIYTLGANEVIKKSSDSDEFKESLKNIDVFWLIKIS